MTATFPAHLQDKILHGTWVEKRRRNFSEFETDSGASLRSKIPGSSRTDCGFEMVLTEDEFSDLEAFYLTDCSDGSVGFYLEHPRKRTVQVFQWAEAPQAGQLAAEQMKISVALIMD